MGRIAAAGLVGALVVFVVIPVLAAMGVFQGNSTLSPVNRNNTANQIVQSGEAIGEIITEGINTGPGVPESSEPIPTIDTNLSSGTEGITAGSNLVPQSSGEWTDDARKLIVEQEILNLWQLSTQDQVMTLGPSVTYKSDKGFSSVEIFGSSGHNAYIKVSLGGFTDYDQVKTKIFSRMTGLEQIEFAITMKGVLDESDQWARNEGLRQSDADDINKMVWRLCNNEVVRKTAELNSYRADHP